jgi:hypothetical protein
MEKLRTKRGARVRVQSPDEGSVVMGSSQSSASSVSSQPSQTNDLQTPVDFGNLANEHKTFPQRDDQSKDSTNSSIASVPYREDKRQKVEEQPREPFRSLEEEKRDLLTKLKRLKDQKVTISRDYSMHSNINDMRNEYEVIRANMQVEASIRFQRKVLIALTSGMEFLNKKYDPFNVELNGWSETIMESITDYDQIFERLHQKYKGSASMPPEFELMMAIAGSAFTFHLSNTFFKKSMGDAMKNPNAMKNIMAEIKKATQTATPQQPTPPMMGQPVPMMGQPTPMMGQPTPPMMGQPTPISHVSKRPQHSGVQICETDSEVSVSSDASASASSHSVDSGSRRVVSVPTPGGRGRGGRGRGRASGRGRGRGKQQVNEILL